MARKKNRGAKPVAVEAKDPPKKSAVVSRWNDYFKKGDLGDWNRLMRDLGFADDFPSITKCRKALKNVWVNVHDFISAVRSGSTPRRFASQHELAAYTFKSRKFFPRELIPKGCPLRQLLANIRQPSIGERRGPKAQIKVHNERDPVHELCADWVGLAIDDSDSD